MERRYFQSGLEVRAADEGKESRGIKGIAAMVNAPTVLWEDTWNGKKERFVEVIKPGAFDGVLGNDVRALFNHNDEKVLGRTTAGTLQITVDERGNLVYDIPDLPNTTFGNDLLVNVQRKEITQSSFGFTFGEIKDVRTETETEITYTREIRSIKALYDVSPVTFPAYQNTTTQLRSTVEQFREQNKPEPAGPTPEQVSAEQAMLRLQIAIRENEA